jgi:catechol 2,3-dioxygenase-like lactoylglutathione lyase family enzyme
VAGVSWLAVAAGAARPLAAQSAVCRSESAAARLDHVTVAVRDLASAASSFRDTLGFSLKDGRVHANGLRNVHVRFADGSALELMSVGDGAPDELSGWYTRFLQEGEGGAFVALRAGPVDTVLALLGELSGEASVLEGPAFDWVSFPAGHPLHAVFFVHVRSRPSDAPGHVRHRNGASGLSEVWLRSSEPRILADLLRMLGATPCGEVSGSGGLSGLGFGLAAGSLVVVPDHFPAIEPRILSVILSGDRSRPGVRSSGVWIEWVKSGS